MGLADLLGSVFPESDMLAELSEDAEEEVLEPNEADEELKEADDAEEAKNSFVSAQALKLIRFKRLIRIIKACGILRNNKSFPGCRIFKHCALFVRVFQIRVTRTKINHMISYYFYYRSSLPPLFPRITP